MTKVKTQFEVGVTVDGLDVPLTDDVSLSVSLSPKTWDQFDTIVDRLKRYGLDLEMHTFANNVWVIASTTEKRGDDEYQVRALTVHAPLDRIQSYTETREVLDAKAHIREVLS